METMIIIVVCVDTVLTAKIQFGMVLTKEKTTIQTRTIIKNDTNYAQTN
jgi:hypothetical protein